MHLYLERLELRNFKNYKAFEAVFSSGINFITGFNASGKTNILDAIYLLSFTKSYFNINDSQLVNTGATDGFYFVKGLYKTGESAEELQVTYRKNSRKVFKRNGKEYERLVDHIGLIPLIMITPGDTVLISEGSEVRRRFLDMLISQFDKEYLYNLVQYNKALKQRNALLKQLQAMPYAGSGMFDPWNEKLSGYGDYIYRKRKEITEWLTKYFNEFYYNIADDKYQLAIRYRSQLSEKSMHELLEESFESDKVLQYTTKGIHKDDLVFTINGLKVKKIASQGQQKTLLLALKLAEKQIIENFSGKHPLLLLDDVFDKLDEVRVTNMIQTLAENNSNQIFITDTHTQRMLDIRSKLKINSQLMEIADSQIMKVYD